MLRHRKLEAKECSFDGKVLFCGGGVIIGFAEVFV
jgi:hypothetical protein